MKIVKRRSLKRYPRTFLFARRRDRQEDAVQIVPSSSTNFAISNRRKSLDEYDGDRSSL